MKHLILSLVAGVAITLSAPAADSLPKLTQILAESSDAHRFMDHEEAPRFGPVMDEGDTHSGDHTGLAFAPLASWRVSRSRR